MKKRGIILLILIIAMLGIVGCSSKEEIESQLTSLDKVFISLDKKDGYDEILKKVTKLGLEYEEVSDNERKELIVTDSEREDDKLEINYNIEYDIVRAEYYRYDYIEKIDYTIPHYLRLSSSMDVLVELMCEIKYPNGKMDFIGEEAVTAVDMVLRSYEINNAINEGNGDNIEQLYAESEMLETTLFDDIFLEGILEGTYDEAIKSIDTYEELVYRETESMGKDYIIIVEGDDVSETYDIDRTYITVSYKDGEFDSLQYNIQESQMYYGKVDFIINYSSEYSSISVIHELQEPLINYNTYDFYEKENMIKLVRSYMDELIISSNQEGTRL